MGKQFTVANGFTGVRYSLANPKNYNSGDTVTLTDAEYSALSTTLTRTIKTGTVTTVAEPAYPTYPFNVGMVGANYSIVVTHGTNANIARPSGATHVLWIGSVQPAHWVTGDEWIDNS